MENSQTVTASLYEWCRSLYDLKNHFHGLYRMAVFEKSKRHAHFLLCEKHDKGMKRDA